MKKYAMTASGIIRFSAFLLKRKCLRGWGAGLTRLSHRITCFPSFNLIIESFLKNMALHL